MSLGHEYDMVLLTPRAPPTNDEVTPRQPRRGRRSGGRSRRARQARHEQGHPDATRIRGDMPPPPISYDQLLAQGPWLGTCLA